MSAPLKKLSVLKHSMLRKFGGGSKNMRAFTSGTGQNLAPDVAERNLDDLIAAGFLRAIKNDSFAITRAGLLALDTYGKASTDKASERVRPGVYVQAKIQVREGADDHFKHASLPMGAQIERVDRMLTIAELEAEIKRVGSLLATAQLQYDESGCFSDVGQVGAYELQMRRLADAREQSGGVA